MAKVSLIMPCYNLEKYINDAIDSVLLQTFKDIELIIVNDGSTDSSEEIILSRKLEIESSISSFKYIKQKNAGVSIACQTGFKNAAENYLMLLDGDDCLFPSSIEKQVIFLEKNPDYAAVRTNGYYTYLETENEKKFLFEENYKENNKTGVWEDIFLGRKHSLSGGYMIRMSVLDEVYPNREIYDSWYGQNLQFLLAASYHKKVGFIDEPLIKYNIRTDSMTHKIEKEQEKREIELLEGFKDIRKHMVENLFYEEEKEEYLRKNEILYAGMFLKVAKKYRNKILAEKNYAKLKLLTDNHVSKADKESYYSVKYPAYQRLIILVNRFWGRIKQIMFYNIIYE